MLASSVKYSEIAKKQLLQVQHLAKERGHGEAAVPAPHQCGVQT